MLEGMYSAAAGMEAQQQRLDVLSNDMANVDTTGYKRVRVAFRDLLYTPTGAGAARGVASGAGAAVTTVGRDRAQGALQQTGRPLDVAIDGPGYIQVRDARGNAVLSRDGSLQRRQNGAIVTSTGDTTGITVPPAIDDSEIQISPNGTVSARGRTYGRLRLVNVRSPDALQSVGDNLFRPTAASGGPVAAGNGTTLLQGNLEASNVDMASVMVDLMDAQRSYDLVSKAINAQDQLLEIANGVKR